MQHKLATALGLLLLLTTVTYLCHLVNALQVQATTIVLAHSSY